MWNLVADSSCDMKHLECSDPEITYARIPFYIRTDEGEFEDNDTLDIRTLLRAMKESKTCSTACPSPADWYERFRRPGNVIAFTISSHLSGSWQSAMLAEKMVLEEEPDKKIAVIDTLQDGPTLTLLIRAAVRLIQERYDFDAVVEHLTKALSDIRIIFALSSFDNLIKNGRVSHLAGLVSNVLGFWVLGTGREGHIHMVSKVRGSRKVLKAILEDLRKQHGTMREIIIVHCLNLPMALELRAMLKETFRDARIDVMESSGLNSFYAEANGLIVSFRCGSV